MKIKQTSKQYLSHKWLSSLFSRRYFV